MSKIRLLFQVLESENFKVPTELLLKYCDIIKRMDQARGVSVSMYSYLDKERSKIAGVKDKHDYTDEFNF